MYCSRPNALWLPRVFACKGDNAVAAVTSMASSACFGFCAPGALRTSCTGRGLLCDSRQSRHRSPAKRARPCCSAKRRNVDPDDLPETFPEGDELPTKLTLAQELLMKSYREQVERMTKAECDDLTVEIMRQNFVKDNILRAMGIKTPDDWLQPPDVDEFISSLREEEEEENDDASGSDSEPQPTNESPSEADTENSGTDADTSPSAESRSEPVNGEGDDVGDKGKSNRDPRGGVGDSEHRNGDVGNSR